ncbi:MAG TPA: PDGLE domain-containing protein [Actinomycetota bacterium]|nr:PDGLE domain-containing protein [Actinomycetota bacterium]
MARTTSRTTIGLFIAGGLLVSLGLAFFVGPLASSSPDGLEKVSIDQGFDGSARDHALGDSTFAEYGVEGVDDEGLATGLAGIVGVVLTFGVGALLFATIRTIRGRRANASGAAAPPA